MKFSCERFQDFIEGVIARDAGVEGGNDLVINHISSSRQRGYPGPNSVPDE